MRVFIEKTTDEIVHWPADAPCTQEEYEERISEPVNKLITENIRTALVNAGHITGGTLYKLNLTYTYCLRKFFIGTRTLRSYQF